MHGSLQNVRVPPLPLAWPRLCAPMSFVRFSGRGCRPGPAIRTIDWAAGPVQQSVGGEISRSGLQAHWGCWASSHWAVCRSVDVDGLQARRGATADVGLQGNLRWGCRPSGVSQPGGIEGGFWQFLQSPSRAAARLGAGLPATFGSGLPATFGHFGHLPRMRLRQRIQT
jgi:hypothetical protein